MQSSKCFKKERSVRLNLIIIISIPRGTGTGVCLRGTATWMTQFQGSDALEGNRIDSKVTGTTDDRVIIALKSGKKERS